MRILISTRYLGGSGGIERHVASTIECLGERHEIDVCATHAVATGYAVAPDRARVLPHEQWDRPSRRKHPVAGTRSVARDWRRRRGALYDAYLHYQHAEHVQRRFPVGVRMVIPCGDDVRSIEDRFDAVLLEAPDNERFVEDKSKAVLFPPPLNVPAARSVAVDGLPAEFFLTIFNPHHPRKGQANMQAVAPRSPIPIVWCRSSQSPYPAERAAAEFDGIVVLEDRTQEELRFLYERCRAYISFDHNQGFGWSLADALQYGVPTLSRGRGVMSLPGLDRTGCVEYDSDEELAELLQRDDFTRVQRNLGDLDPRRFVERFEALVRVLQVARPRAS